MTGTQVPALHRPLAQSSAARRDGTRRLRSQGRVSAFLIHFWGGRNANKKDVDRFQSHVFVEVRSLLSIPVSGQHIKIDSEKNQKTIESI